MSAVLRKLFRHMRWADKRVLESLETAAHPPATTLELFSHVVATEHVWLSRILGQTPKVAIWPKLSLAQCAELAEQNADEFNAIIESSDEITLEGGITYKNSTGAQFTSELEDILIHVALHGMYHRGQIAAGVRSGGDVPASTDYITMVRGVPTATKQP